KASLARRVRCRLPRADRADRPLPDADPAVERRGPRAVERARAGAARGRRRALDATRRGRRPLPRPHDRPAAGRRPPGLLDPLRWGPLRTVVTLASQRPRRQAAEKEEQALSDGLTGLPNRTMFTDLVQSTLTGAGRRKHAGAVMLMDLDRFKDVNDTLGHHNG